MSGRVNRLVVVAAVIVAWGSTAPPIRAQEGAPPSPGPGYRWVITGSLGTTSGGPAGGIERAMTAAGFDSTMPPLFGGGSISFPYSRTGAGEIGVSWMIAARYAVASPVSVGVIVSDAPIGATHGLNGWSNFLSLKYSVFTVAPTVSVRLSDAFHLGGGPALYRTEARQVDMSAGRPTSYLTTKVGALVELGVSLPVRSRAFWTASLQYRFVGSATIGPFESSGFDHSATLPATSVSYDHFFFSMGAGVRL